MRDSPAMPPAANEPTNLSAARGFRLLATIHANVPTPIAAAVVAGTKNATASAMGDGTNGAARVRSSSESTTPAPAPTTNAAPAHGGRLDVPFSASSASARQLK